MADITLTVGGKIYGGWTSGSVQRGIEQISGQFSLVVTERWPDHPARREIKAGNACTVSIGGEVVITGRVDDVARKYNAKGHTVTVTGRDATGYMVDCSPPLSPSEWSGLTLEQIAAILAKPFGVKVSANVDVGKPFPTFALQPGEKVFEAISRACKQRAILPIADGKGGLLLTRGGKVQGGGHLADGDNIKDADWRNSWRDRYSTVTVISQGGGLGSPADDAEGKAVATDAEITVPRPLVVIAEDLADGITLQDRANWEVRTRKAKGKGGSIDVQGWRHQGGRVWQPNSLVIVKAPAGGVTGNLLISSVTFKLSKQDGTITSLELVGDGAYDLLPAKGGDGWM